MWCTNTGQVISALGSLGETLYKYRQTTEIYS